MARRSDHSREELKALVLSVAWSLIEEEGVGSVTARRVAKEVGYAPGTIYNLFESMDDLYLQINAQTLDLLAEVLNAPVCHDAKKTPVENIKEMAVHYSEFSKSHRAHWLMLFTHTLSDGDSAPSWYRDKVEELFNPLELLLSPFYNENQKVEHKLAVRGLWASVHGVCFLAETGRDSIVLNQEKISDVMTYLIDTFMAGVSLKS